MDLLGLLLVVLGVLTTVGSYLWFRVTEARQRRRYEELQLALETGSDDEDATGWPARVARQPAPEPPEALWKALVAHECVLFAGTGVGAQIGAPTWNGLLRRVVGRLDREEPGGDWDVVAREVEKGDYHVVADVLATRVGRDDLFRRLREAADLTAPVGRPSPLADLGKLPFAGVVTNDWGDLLDEVFAAKKPAKLGPFVEPGRFVDALRDRSSPFLLQLYGRLDDQSLLFTAQQYREVIEDDRALARFLASLYSTYSLFFMGTSLSGIQEFLSSSGFRPSTERRHFALVPSERGQQLDAERLEARYNLEIIPFTPSPGFPEMLDFVSLLRRRVRDAGGTRARPARGSVRPHVLRHVSLRNIGPFAELELEVDERWTVLLGDNGCGKSTILRAIALALCGDDDRAQAAGTNVLRSGQTSGSIELRVGKDVYRTHLRLERGRVRVIPEQVTPIQSGTWLAMGFPPLRGLTASDRAMVMPADLSVPLVEDVLPLATGTVDARLGDFERWVHGELTSAGAARRFARFETLFEFLAKLTPGVEFSLARKQDIADEVLVKTSDGTVPLRLLSQGMTSTLGWIGTMLHRFAQVYDDDLETRDRPALVLVDEIDAHLHPEWQRKIVGLVQESFPHVQVVATTHSPFVVGNLDSGQLYRVKREVSRLELERIDTSYHAHRADQILTGQAFGMESTRSESMDKPVDRYRELLAIGDPSRAERMELAELSARLGRELPEPEEHEVDREARKLASEVLRRQVDAPPTPEQQEILDEAQEYLRRMRSD